MSKEKSQARKPRPTRPRSRSKSSTLSLFGKSSNFILTVLIAAPLIYYLIKNILIVQTQSTETEKEIPNDVTSKLQMIIDSPEFNTIQLLKIAAQYSTGQILGFLGIGVIFSLVLFSLLSLTTGLILKWIGFKRGIKKRSIAANIHQELGDIPAKSSFGTLQSHGDTGRSISVLMAIWHIIVILFTAAIHFIRRRVQPLDKKGIYGK